MSGLCAFYVRLMMLHDLLLVIWVFIPVNTDYRLVCDWSISFRNRNGRKRMFQMKETRKVIILLNYTENETLKQSLDGACLKAQHLALSILELIENLLSHPWVVICQQVK